VSRKIFDTAQVAIDGSLGIITPLEFLQHHFSEMGHGNTSCDPNLSQPPGNHRSVTSRAASAARAASFKRGSGKYPLNLQDPCIQLLPVPLKRNTEPDHWSYLPLLAPA
jgi:hypothetical protein